MKKTFIRTSDLFRKRKSMNKRLRLCENVARQCHLHTKIKYANEGVELHLVGSRMNVCKYYIRTISKEDGIMNGIKRVIEVLT